MTCSDARERLSALLERPPPQGSESLREHVEGCADCRAELTLLIATDDEVRGALSRLGPAAPPPGYFDTLAARVDAGLDAPPKSAERKGAARLMWALGLTSAICGAAGAAFFVKTRMGSWGGVSSREAPPPVAERAPAPAAAPEAPADQPAEKAVAQPTSRRRVGPDATQIDQAMAAVAPQVRACGHGAPAVVNVRVAPGGQVTSVDAEPPLAGSAAEACVVTAIKRARFAAWTGPPFLFRHSFDPREP